MTVKRVLTALIMLSTHSYIDVAAKVSPNNPKRLKELLDFLHRTKGDFPRFFIMLSEHEQERFTNYLNRAADKYEGSKPAQTVPIAD